MSIKSDFKVTSGLDIANGSLKINGSAGTAGQVLISNGDSNAPTWSVDSDRLRKITISTLTPTGGVDGDVWFKV